MRASGWTTHQAACLGATRPRRRRRRRRSSSRRRGRCRGRRGGDGGRDDREGGYRGNFAGQGAQAGCEGAVTRAAASSGAGDASAVGRRSREASREARTATSREKERAPRGERDRASAPIDDARRRARATRGGSTGRASHAMRLRQSVLRDGGSGESSPSRPREGRSRSTFPDTSVRGSARGVDPRARGRSATRATRSKLDATRSVGAVASRRFQKVSSPPGLGSFRLGEKATNVPISRTGTLLPELSEERPTSWRPSDGAKWRTSVKKCSVESTAWRMPRWHPSLFEERTMRRGLNTRAPRRTPGSAERWRRLRRGRSERRRARPRGCARPRRRGARSRPDAQSRGRRSWHRSAPRRAPDRARRRARRARPPGRVRSRRAARGRGGRGGRRGGASGGGRGGAGGRGASDRSKRAAGRGRGKPRPRAPPRPLPPPACAPQACASASPSASPLTASPPSRISQRTPPLSQPRARTPPRPRRSAARSGRGWAPKTHRRPHPPPPPRFLSPSRRRPERGRLLILLRQPRGTSRRAGGRHPPARILSRDAPGRLQRTAKNSPRALRLELEEEMDRAKERLDTWDRARLQREGYALFGLRGMRDGMLQRDAVIRVLKPRVGGFGADAGADPATPAAAAPLRRGFAMGIRASVPPFRAGRHGFPDGG